MSIEEDYNRLRRDNTFRKSPNGFALYKEFRDVIGSGNEYDTLAKIAQDLGTSVQTLYNQRAREFRRLHLPTKNAKRSELKNIHQIVHESKTASSVVSKAITANLSTNELAAMHQDILMLVSREIQELLTGTFEIYRRETVEVVKKRDDPKFMAILPRLIETQRKLIEDRLTLFGMLKDVDTYLAVDDLNSKYQRAIDVIVAKAPELLSEFVEALA